MTNDDHALLPPGYRTRRAGWLAGTIRLSAAAATYDPREADAARERARAEGRRRRARRPGRGDRAPAPCGTPGHRSVTRRKWHEQRPGESLDDCIARVERNVDHVTARLLPRLRARAGLDDDSEPIDLDALTSTPQAPAAQPDPHGRTAP